MLDISRRKVFKKYGRNLFGDCGVHSQKLFDLFFRKKKTLAEFWKFLARIFFSFTFEVLLWYLNLSVVLEVGVLLVEGGCYFILCFMFFLTHYCLKLFFCQILRYSPRRALIVYRLTDAALTWNFFPWSLLFFKTKIWSYGNYSYYTIYNTIYNMYIYILPSNIILNE